MLLHFKADGPSVRDGERLLAALVAAGDMLEQRRAEINALNVFPVPDGDTGTNMLLTWQAVCAAVRAAYISGERRVGMLLQQGAEAALLHARGSSGLILSQCLMGAARELRDRAYVRPADLGRALVAANETARATLINPVEGTILSVLEAAGVAATTYSAANPNAEWTSVLVATTAAAAAALARTPSQLDVLARANRVDAGGSGLVALLDGLTAYARTQPQQQLPGNQTEAHLDGLAAYTRTDIPDGPVFVTQADVTDAARLYNTTETSHGPVFHIPECAQLHLLEDQASTYQPIDRLSPVLSRHGAPEVAAGVALSADQLSAEDNASLASQPHESYGYCTQFLIMAPGRDPQDLRSEIAMLGEAAQIVGNADMIRVHVHTPDPGAALSWAIHLGRLADIRVEDMQAQHDRHKLPALHEDNTTGIRSTPLASPSRTDNPNSSGSLSVQDGEIAYHCAERPTPVEGLQVYVLVAGAGFARACAELGANAFYRLRGIPQNATIPTAKHGTLSVQADETQLLLPPGQTEGIRILTLVCADARMRTDEIVYSTAKMQGYHNNGSALSTGTKESRREITVPTSAHAIAALLALRQGQTFDEAIEAITARVACTRWCDLATIWQHAPIGAHIGEQLLPSVDVSVDEPVDKPVDEPADAPDWLHAGIIYTIAALDQAGARSCELISLFCSSDPPGSQGTSRQSPIRDSWATQATSLLTEALSAAFPHAEIEVIDGGQPGSGYLALLE